MNWRGGSAIFAADSGLAVRQVYSWCITLDKKFVIVSTDGQTWQLPGGKPTAGESMINTAIRELHEETGLKDYSPSSFKFFGYYRVTAGDEKFLQVRMLLYLDQFARELRFSSDQEDKAQDLKHQIIAAKTVDSAEAEELIPWLPMSGEYKELRTIGVL